MYLRLFVQSCLLKGLRNLCIRGKYKIMSTVYASKWSLLYFTIYLRLFATIHLELFTVRYQETSMSSYVGDEYF